MLLILLLILAAPLLPVKTEQLEIIGEIKLDIPEPSDLCVSNDGEHLFIVSDKGRLYKTNLDGEIVDRADFKGSDFEAVCILNDELFVVDETLRNILTFDATSLKLKDSKQYIYLGGMNRGWESILFDPTRNRFLAFTERLPLLLFEFDDDLDQKGVSNIEGIREVSGATFHDNYIWSVSDEDRTVYALSPKSYKIKGSWKIPVLNPEGLAFVHGGKELWVISDDLHRIYKFKTPVE